MLKTQGARPTYVHMAMLGKDGKQAHVIGLCKEYVLDCVYKSVHPQSAFNSLYAIHYAPVFLDKVQVIVHGLNGWANNSLHLINLVEKTLDMPQTTLTELPGQYHVFQGNRRWLISPPMLSLYTLLIRAGRSCDGGDLDTATQAYYNCKGMNTDVGYMKQARPGLEHILTYGDRFVFGNNMAANWTSCGDIHGRGIINFSSGGLYDLQPRWYRRFKLKSQRLQWT